ncbi:MAG: twin-arginine translocation pathway signal protein [Pseudomonadota bacterium]
MVSRRAVLTTGTASAVLLGLGGAWWVSTGPAQRAREPWRAAEAGFGDPRLDILAYAILAPNAHNMQPWQIALDDASGFTLFCNPERLLPETDPPGRQLTISFGCFLELCRMAAAESGLRADVDLFPEGEPQPMLDARPIARVSLVPDASVTPDPLFEGVLTRRTNRVPFDTERSVAEEDLAAITAVGVPGVALAGTAERSRVDLLRQLAVDAWSVEWSTDATRRESIEVMHIGKSEVEAAPYGVSVDDRFTSTMGLFGVVTPESLDDPESVAFRESYAYYEQACASATAFVWSTTSRNSRHHQIAAGRAWVRAQLIANARGIAFHPLSQALQEFPEMAQNYRRAHDLLAREDGDTVQMLARVGYAPKVGPSPRHPLESRIIAT